MHGWGFDAAIWSELVRLLPEFDFALADQGYFGSPATARPEAPCIAVTHSMGAMLVLADPPPACRGLVVFNGFDCFVAQDGFPGVASRIVERMVNQFESRPEAVLADFRRRCGGSPAAGPLDRLRLAQDLRRLRDGDLRAATSRWSLPLLSVHGGQDPILPPAMRGQAFASAPLLAKVTRESGGHLLPQSDAAFCAAELRRFAGALR